MQQSARLRVGVIGGGLIAQVMHLHHLRERSDLFDVRAICDLSPTVRQRLAHDYNIARQTERWEDLLDEPLDAVMILTSGSHAPIAVAAAKAGLHIFVEKPMCFSVDEGLEMVAAARREQVVLQVGYNKRYDPAYERLQSELRELGAIRLVRLTTLESPLAPYVSQYPLIKGSDVPEELIRALRAEDERRVARAIGLVDPLVSAAYRWVLLDSLVHELNAIRGLLGEPDRLEFSDVRQNGVTTIFTFDDVQCVLSWVDLQSGIARYRMELAFYAPDRRATLVFPSPFLRNAPTQLVFEGGEVGTPRSWETVETTSYEESFRRELEEFYRCIVEQREPRTSGVDGLRDVALCQAIVAGHVARVALEKPSALPRIDRGVAANAIDLTR